MGIGTLGFLKGATKTHLDTMDTREKQRMLLERDKKLEELRREGEDIAFKRTEASKGKEVKEERVNADGTIEMVNSRGEVIGTRKENLLEKQARENRQKLDALTLEDKEVGIANTRDTIRSRGLDDARQDRVAGAQIGSYNRSGRDTTASLDGGSGGNKLDMRANELVYQHKDAVAEAVENGVPRAVAEKLASDVVLQAARLAREGKTVSSRDLYLQALTDLRLQAKAPKKPKWHQAPPVRR